MPHDQTGPRRRAIPSRRRIVLAVVIFAAIGAVVGVKVAQWRSAERSIALLNLAPALMVTSGTPPAPDEADRFVQSELLYLNSTGFQRAVAAEAGHPSGASVSATQVGSTDVVQLAGVAPTGRQAQRVAAAAVTAYAAHRRSVLTAEASGFQTQLAAAQKDLVNASGQNTDTGPLQDRVNSLQSQIDGALAAAHSSVAGGSLVESPKDSGSSPTVSPTAAGGGGLAAGALLGLLIAAVPRLTSRRVSSPDDAAEFGLPVLRPQLPTTRRKWADTLSARPSDDPVERAARMLAVPLAEQLSEGRPLVLVGVTRRVGTSFAAVNVATALARRRPTVLVPVADVAGARVAGWFGVPADGAGLLEAAEAASAAGVEAVLTTTPVPRLRLLTVAPTGRLEPVEDALSGRTIPLLLDAGWTVVVDCPPAGRSTAALELAPLHPVTGVVAARGRTTVDDLAETIAELGSDEKARRVIVLNRAPRWMRHAPRLRRGGA